MDTISRLNKDTRPPRGLRNAIMVVYALLLAAVLALIVVLGAGMRPILTAIGAVTAESFAWAARYRRAVVFSRFRQSSQVFHFSRGIRRRTQARSRDSRALII